MIQLRALAFPVVGFVIMVVAVLTGFSARSVMAPHNYLTLHYLLDFYTVYVILAASFVAWYLFKKGGGLREGVMCILLLNAGLFGAAHALSYPGMPNFIVPNSMDKSIYYYFLSRYFAASAFIVFPLGFAFKVNKAVFRYLLLATGYFVALFFGCAVLIYHNTLPALFISETEPTGKSVLVETALLLLFVVANYLIFKRYRRLQEPECIILIKGIIFAILAEIGMFIDYNLPAGTYLILAHFYLVVAYTYYFRALFISAVEKAYDKLTQTEQCLMRAERLSSLGTIAAGTVHEIRNSLTSIKGFVQIIKHRVDRGQAVKSKDLKVYTGLMLSEIDRTNVLLNEFLLFARPQQAVLKIYNLEKLIGDMLPIIKNQGLLKEVEVVASIASMPMLVQADPYQIKQILLNLANNAFEAMENSSRKLLSISCYPMPCKSKFKLEVADTGHGIPLELQDRIFEPFFSTKEQKKGAGLGLSVVKNIVRNHNGSIWVNSEPGRGTCFVIEFPSVLASSNLKKTAKDRAG